MSVIPIAIVGIGKIARDEHIPVIAASPRFELAGAVSRHASDLGVPVFASLGELRAALPEVRTIAVCTPPIGRMALLREAFALGFDVLMEKPPAATLAEAARFAPMAQEAGRALFLSWHSRAASAVDTAKQWLAGRRIRHIAIDWLEDVRVWHPGQDWIWEPGIGVFDPGINALSILTRLVGDVTVVSAALEMPANRDAPIAAELALDSADCSSIAARFSFAQAHPQIWEMRIETDDGVARLVKGGNRLLVDDVEQTVASDGEYARLYARFAEVLDAHAVDADLAPFRLVADAFMLGTRRTVGAFDW